MSTTSVSSSFREIVVFLPDEGAGYPAPVETARALTTFLGVGRADLGVDALTGAVELRLHDDPTLYYAARNYLQGANVLFEIERR